MDIERINTVVGITMTALGAAGTIARAIPAATWVKIERELPRVANAARLARALEEPGGQHKLRRGETILVNRAPPALDGSAQRQRAVELAFELRDRALTLGRLDAQSR